MKVRVPLSTHFGHVVAVDLAPSEVREYVDAPPCPHCGGRGVRGTHPHIERCNPCEATGLELAFERPEPK